MSGGARAAVEVKVPALGESINEGVIARWVKQGGEFVQADETLLELETDKAVMEVPAETAGQLEVLVPAGQTVRVDQVVARLLPGPAPAQERSPERVPQPQPAAEEAPPLSPAVRKLVAERGLDPLKVPASGKGGRLTKEDVLAFLESRQEPAEAQPVEAEASGGDRAPTRSAQRLENVRREPLSPLRQRIAQRLVEAQRSAAILTTFNDVDMSAVLELRKRYREAFEAKHGVRLGFMALFARAVVGALGEVPRLNARLEGTDVVQFERVHLGIAVSTERGLLVPVVREADQKGVPELERAIAELARKGRAGRLTPDELSGGTFSLTNGGVFGSLLSTPILNPPQSGILGMHRIEERPVAVEGRVEVRPMMYLALSYDHRLVDGREAVTFLRRVKEFLQDPARLVLEV